MTLVTSWEFFGGKFDFRKIRCSSPFQFSGCFCQKLIGMAPVEEEEGGTRMLKNHQCVWRRHDNVVCFNDDATPTSFVHWRRNKAAEEANCKLISRHDSEVTSMRNNLFALRIQIPNKGSIVVFSILLSQKFVVKLKNLDYLENPTDSCQVFAQGCPLVFQNYAGQSVKILWDFS